MSRIQLTECVSSGDYSVNANAMTSLPN